MSSAPPAPVPTPPAPPPWPRPVQLALALLALTAFGLAAARHSTALGNRPRPTEVRVRVEPAAVDLNRASRAELLQLPGVGPKLADHIEAVRDRRRFRRVEDLRDVPGVGEATFQRLRPWVTVDPDGEPIPPPTPAPQPDSPPAEPRRPADPGGLVDLNRATAAELDRLPGIGPKRAQQIIDERAKRPFTSVEDLRRVSGIGPKTLEKLRPLVTVGPGPSTGERF